MIGGIAQTQEMLNFCGRHNITSDVEVIAIQQINEVYERQFSDLKPVRTTVRADLVAGMRIEITAIARAR